MDPLKQQLLPMLLKCYQDETPKQLLALAEGVPSLAEKNDGWDESLKTLIRAAHSIKGSSWEVELNSAGEVAEKLEKTLRTIEKSKLAPEIGALYEICEQIEKLRKAIEADLLAIKKYLPAEDATTEQQDSLPTESQILEEAQPQPMIEEGAKEDASKKITGAEDSASKRPEFIQRFSDKARGLIQILSMGTKEPDSASQKVANNTPVPNFSLPVTEPEVPVQKAVNAPTEEKPEPTATTQSVAAAPEPALITDTNKDTSPTRTDTSATAAGDSAQCSTQKIFDGFHTQSSDERSSVLIISGSSERRTHLKDQIREGGYYVVVAATGNEAINYLCFENFNLLIIDYQLPDTTAIDFVEQIQNISRMERIPRILLAAGDKIDLANKNKGLFSDIIQVDSLNPNDILERINGIIGKTLSDHKELFGAVSSEPPRVLIIDDSLTLRTSLNAVLTSVGMKVFLAEDPEKGDKMVREVFPDVVLLDVVLPKIDGITLCQQWREQPGIRDIPVILMSGDNDAHERRASGINAGAVCFIKKPCEPAEVIAQVHVMCNLRRTYQKLQEKSISLQVSFQELSETRKLLEEKAQFLEQASNYKSSFLANMSHELRTPLTAIRGFAETLLFEGQSEDARKESVNTIVRNCQHLLELINDILDISKIEAGKLEIESIETSPVHVMKDVETLMRSKAEEKGLNFIIEFSTPIPDKVMTDALRLKQVIVNLVGNAIKFTEHGQVKVDISFNKEKELMTFAITDSGIGISEEQISKLFKAFSQAESGITRRFGGTGLGLKISEELTKRLGGSIVVTSKIGEGSTFAASIKTGPVSEVREITYNTLASATTSSAAPKIPPKGSIGGKILIAEDTRDNQRILSFYLNQAGLNFTFVENGQLAVEEATKGGFNLILMDMHMPIMDGYTATKTLRDSGYTGPIVAATAAATTQDVDRCYKAGCDYVVTKPYNWAQFFSTLKKYLPAGEQSETTTSESGQKKEVGQPSLTLVQQALATTEPYIPWLVEQSPDLIPLVLEFLSEIENYRSRVTKSFEEKNWEELRAVAHAFSGTASMYGYPEGSKIAKELQRSAEAKQEEKCKTFTEQLNHLFERMIKGRAIIIERFPEAAAQATQAQTQEAKEQATPTPQPESPLVSSTLVNSSPDLIPLILDFLKELETTVGGLSKAATDNNWTHIATTTNQMAGTASLYGYPDFYDLAKEIETIAQSDKPQNSIDKIEQMKIYARGMIKGIPQLEEQAKNIEAANNKETTQQSNTATDSQNGAAGYSHTGAQAYNAFTMNPVGSPQQLTAGAPDFAPLMISFVNNVEAQLYTLQNLFQIQDWQRIPQVCAPVAQTGTIYNTISYSYMTYVDLVTRIQQAVEQGQHDRARFMLGELQQVANSLKINKERFIGYWMYR